MNDQDKLYLNKAGFNSVGILYTLAVENGILKVYPKKDKLVVHMGIAINTFPIFWEETVNPGQVQEGFTHIIKRARAEVALILENVKEMETFL